MGLCFSSPNSNSSNATQDASVAPVLDIIKKSLSGSKRTQLNAAEGPDMIAAKAVDVVPNKAVDVFPNKADVVVPKSSSASSGSSSVSSKDAQPQQKGDEKELTTEIFMGPEGANALVSNSSKDNQNPTAQPGEQREGSKAAEIQDQNRGKPSDGANLLEQIMMDDIPDNESVDSDTFLEGLKDDLSVIQHQASDLERLHNCGENHQDVTRTERDRKTNVLAGPMAAKAKENKQEEQYAGWNENMNPQRTSNVGRISSKYEMKTMSSKINFESMVKLGLIAESGEPAIAQL